MASLSLAAPSRGGRYICTTCRESLRSLRSPQFATTRALSTASLPNRQPALPSTFRRNQHLAPLSKTEIVPRHHTSRPYSTLTESLDAGGFAPLPHRRLISLSGPDAPKFLQGLVTNNVNPNSRAHFYSAFLDARGRVLWDVFVWITEEKGDWACYIEVDGSELEVLKKHLKRHKLRSKVQIQDVSEEEMRVWAAWGTAVNEVEDQSVLSSLKDPRGENLSRYLTSGTTTTLTAHRESRHVTDYHIQRYTLGIPEGQTEIPRESALPLEYNIDLSHGIDFKKGCYVGQELTIRTKHTGIVRKRVLPVCLTLVKPLPDAHPESTIPSISPTPGAEIKQLDGQANMKKGRPAGKFVAGIGNVGLALCRLENMTGMKVSAEGGTWKEGMVFGVESEEGVVRVEPMLRERFLVKEGELWGKNRLRG